MRWSWLVLIAGWVAIALYPPAEPVLSVFAVIAMIYVTLFVLLVTVVDCIWMQTTRAFTDRTDKTIAAQQQ